ncbi:hypothetical protein GWK91_11910 [Virgibacillus sp. MSP4-1]|uniref:hypothetical protein n=1 Tax=Virgibacillus sp. MSP4-1 TaxID=2700081 RepID=UPI00039F5420|nr:hypothetical protein [Virgibacillus sp. MSP4-1]QHS23616.1 hypothetical protein GWK91_11910 [Virgibacillus sp. MSP4-1]
MNIKNVLFVNILILLLTGCSPQANFDTTYLLESDEIIITARTFQDGKRVTNIGGYQGRLTTEENIESFSNLVSGMNFKEISSNQAGKITTSNTSDSLTVGTKTTDQTKKENLTVLTFYKDGTVLGIEFENGTGKHFYQGKPKNKSLYSKIYKWYEKNKENSLKIQ